MLIEIHPLAGSSDGRGLTEECLHRGSVLYFIALIDVVRLEQ